MAVPVDSFSLLWKEICNICNEIKTAHVRTPTVRDVLVILGAIYAGGKIVRSAKRLYEIFKVYGLSRCVQGDLVKKYGPWAVVTGSTHGIGKAYAQELASAGVNIVIISLGQIDCERAAKELVVTGCTGGIGEAYTKELAAKGQNIVLIGRNHDKLENLSKYLEDTFGVETLTVPVDFDEGRNVYAGIRVALEDKDIGILVNNVGVMYDYPQMFLDVPEQKLWQLIHVNVAAATMMTSIVLPGMVKRGRGAVVTVSSGSSVMPTPQMTAYCATKAYLDIFMRALSYENKNSGVTFQVLMPFYVATRMTQYSSTLSNPSLLIPSATVYARHALLTLGWAERTCGYWPHTVQAWLSSYLSESVWMWGAMRLNDALRRQAQSRMRRRSSAKNL